MTAARTIILLGTFVLASLPGCAEERLGAGDRRRPRSNGRILFSAYGEGKPGLYSVRPDGSKRMKHAPGSIESADVSPDGSRVAYTTGRRQVYLVDFNGSEPRAFATGRSFMLSAAWSPDGSRLAFESIRLRFEGPIRIGVVDFGCGDQRFLTPRNAYTQSPSWSPDSARIVYHCEAFSGNYGDICVMNANGSSKRTLFGTERDEEDPGLSPDGEHVALLQYGGHESPGGLVVVEADEGREIFRTGEGTNVEHADWAPDSERIAYLTCRATRCRINVVALDDGSLKSYAVDEMYDLVWAPGRYVHSLRAGHCSGPRSRVRRDTNHRR